MKRRILIVDDLATNRMMLKSKLAVTHHELLSATSLSEACALARRQPINLILLDFDMPNLHAADFCRQIRELPCQGTTAIIAVTARPDLAIRLQALEAGADDILPRNVAPAVLQARIRSLLRMGLTEKKLTVEAQKLEQLSLAEPATSFEHRATIGLIASDPAEALRWRTALSPHLHESFVLLTRETALAAAGMHPDVYLIADDLGEEESGCIVMSELQSISTLNPPAICLMVADQATNRVAVALDFGADEVMPLTFAPAEAAARLKRLLRLKQRRDRLRNQLSAGLRLAIYDPLTDLSNRRHALPALAQMCASGRSCALLLLDVDHFKSVNDRFGHPVGDKVLAELAGQLRRSFPEFSLLARLGGDEFMVALPQTSEEEAQFYAERLRQAVAKLSIRPTPLSMPISITTSIGLAVSSGSDETVEQLLARADRALLAAKAKGRDCITLRGYSAA